MAPSSWSPDGRTLAVVQDSGVGLLDLATQRVTSFLPAPARFAAFSPDGRWLAYSGELRRAFLQAEVTSSTPDPNPGNNSRIHITRIIGRFQ